MDFEVRKTLNEDRMLSLMIKQLKPLKEFERMFVARENDLRVRVQRQDQQKKLKMQALGNQSLRNQNKRLKQEHLAFRRESQRKLQQLNLQKAELQQANSRLVQLENDHKERQESKISILQKTNAQLQAKIKAFESHRMLHQSQFLTDIAKHQAKVEELEEQNTQLRKRLKRNEQVRLQLQESNNKLREEYAQLYANFERTTDERISHLNQGEEHQSFSGQLQKQRYASSAVDLQFQNHLQ